MLRYGERQAEQAAKTAARLELLLNEEPGSVWACDYSGDRESVSTRIMMCSVCQCRYVEEEGLERTFRYRQQEMVAVVPLANQQHFFDLRLEQLGPYSIRYSCNGR